MYRVRYRVNQHPWVFLPGCFGSKKEAVTAMHAYAERKDGAGVEKTITFRAVTLSVILIGGT